MVCNGSEQAFQQCRCCRCCLELCVWSAIAALSTRLQEEARWNFCLTPRRASKQPFAFTFVLSATNCDQLGTSLTPTPTSLRHNPTEDLHGTIASQNQTISTLQSRLSSLRSSHEVHVSSLAETHAAEVASLRNYAKQLEEQLAQHPSLHHGECDCTSLTAIHYAFLISQLLHPPISDLRSSCSPPPTNPGFICGSS
jgi:hypothetical protein